MKVFLGSSPTFKASVKENKATGPGRVGKPTGLGQDSLSSHTKPRQTRTPAFLTVPSRVFLTS